MKWKMKEEEMSWPSSSLLHHLLLYSFVPVRTPHVPRGRRTFAKGNETIARFFKREIKKKSFSCFASTEINIRFWLRVKFSLELKSQQEQRNLINQLLLLSKTYEKEKRKENKLKAMTRGYWPRANHRSVGRSERRNQPGIIIIIIIILENDYYT